MSSPPLPLIFLARHGETEWSRSGRHTGLTDLPLTPRGENDARDLAAPLSEVPFTKVFTSPLQRASRTCALAGFASQAASDPDLVEWNYGDYEGLTSPEIEARRPGWQLFRDGCPNGESPADIGARADRVVSKVRAIHGNVLLFSSGHFLRTLAARWLALPPGAGSLLYLSTATLSTLGYEHTLTEPVLRLWNSSPATRT